MYSIQEMIEKTITQRKIIEQNMEESKGFHPEDANIFNGQKRSISRELSESLRTLGLPKLLEYLSKSGTTDAAYLIPDLVSARLYSSLQTRDIVPLISADIVQPKSDMLKVNVGLLGADFTGKGGGGSKPQSTSDTVQATITLQKISCNIAITNELLEDQEYGLMDWHIVEAGKALASKAANLALTVLKTATDGRGTNVALAAGSDTTTPAQVGAAISLVGSGAQMANFPGFVADTMVCTSEAWGDAISTTAGNTVYPPQRAGYDAWVGGLNVVFCNDPALHGGFTSNRMINCTSPVFAKDYALLTARKSWLRIENYSHPFEDLAGAVVTGRQDSVTMNDDAIVALLES